MQFPFEVTKTNTNDFIFNAGSANLKLSQIIEDLPNNCYVNKTITGCGATTVTLINNEDYLVLVPFVNLVESKVYQHPEVLGITVNTSIRQIKEYIKTREDNNLPIKLIGTYDCLERLLTNQEGIDVTKYKLMIDEAHLLVNLASFKKGVCQYILNHFTDFERYVFVTATPTKREYLPIEIENLPLFIIKWTDVAEANFKTYYLSSDVSMIKKLTALSLSALLDEESREIHIFYNSVHEILQVLLKLKRSEEIEFSREDFRIICSKSQKAKVQDVLGKKFGTINTLIDPVCKINFYTSTAFEGGDVYSNLPETCEQYICINGSRDHTKLDFTSTVSQIVGRIRNKADNNIHFLISNAPESIKFTEEEWENEVKSRVTKTKASLEELNSGKLTEMSAEGIFLHLLKSPFTLYDENTKELEVSDVAVKCELQAYQALHATYYVHSDKINQSKANRLDVILKETNTYSDYEIKYESYLLHIVGYSYFQKAIETYCELKNSNSNPELVKIMDEHKPEIKEYYDNLGYKKIKSLGYSETRILRELDKKEADNKIKELLPSFNIGEFYTNKDVKEIIQKFYQTEKVDLKAKASDISKWYAIKPAKSKGINGIRIEKVL